MANDPQVNVQVGRLLRANTRACVAGCLPSQNFPPFGSLVSIDLGQEISAYGLVSDIHIDDDGLVRQLVTTPNISETVIQDNRVNRNVPVELSVLFVGHRSAGVISHRLPPRPPLSLDRVRACGEGDVCAFTSAGSLGYLRFILEAQDLPAADLLAAHLLQAGRAQRDHGDEQWFARAIDKVITQLRDDYVRLMPVLEALADVQRELGI
ncbi:hypothetical protein [Pelolinea submarina]|uniref:Uncharacterized protein n=1 Tax=Pelolinea submarina TaxID=913107 RepID=A0A347ZNL8_9CHLR|nr:hypothetical protein [Pelolinea submarina]REG08502.1 hypothetical protein DFR64_1870 [Pelolinea submarina]BBB46899.1 hypothetical protein Pelsub_P0126 [Pelolinea submarina]